MSRSFNSYLLLRQAVLRSGPPPRGRPQVHPLQGASHAKVRRISQRRAISLFLYCGSHSNLPSRYDVDTAYLAGFEESSTLTSLRPSPFQVAPPSSNKLEWLFFAWLILALPVLARLNHARRRPLGNLCDIRGERIGRECGRLIHGANSECPSFACVSFHVASNGTGVSTNPIHPASHLSALHAEPRRGNHKKPSPSRTLQAAVKLDRFEPSRIHPAGRAIVD